MFKAVIAAALLCTALQAHPLFAENAGAQTIQGEQQSPQTEDEQIAILLGNDKETYSLSKCERENFSGFIRSKAGDIYYLKNGEKQVGIQYIGPRMYYFDRDGKQRRGVFTNNEGKAFNFAGPLGEAISGWLGDSYFTPADCHRVSGFQTIDGNLYFFSDDGKAKHGEYEIDGKTYCFSGFHNRAVSGWHNKKYFSPEDKAMETGLQEIDGKLYFLGSDGAYKTGIVKTDDDKTYNFAYSNGHAQSGWYHENYSGKKGKNYYFSPDDFTMQTGVCKIKNKYCIFNDDGTLDYVADDSSAAIYEGANNQGDSGNFCAPAQNINVALYSSSCLSVGASDYAKQICDNQNSACVFLDTPQYIICDHWNQGNFLNMKDAAGSYAYVTVGDKTTRYICTKVVNGYNNGPQLGINGGPVFFDTRNYYGVSRIADLITYTCNGCWQNIWVGFWEKT